MTAGWEEGAVGKRWCDLEEILQSMNVDMGLVLACVANGVKTERVSMRVRETQTNRTRAFRKCAQCASIAQRTSSLTRRCILT